MTKIHHPGHPHAQPGKDPLPTFRRGLSVLCFWKKVALTCAGVLGALITPFAANLWQFGGDSIQAGSRVKEAHESIVEIQDTLQQKAIKDAAAAAETKFELGQLKYNADQFHDDTMREFDKIDSHLQKQDDALQSIDLRLAAHNISGQTLLKSQPVTAGTEDAARPVN